MADEIVIDDENVSAESVWSSAKTNSETEAAQTVAATAVAIVKGAKDSILDEATTAIDETAGEMRQYVDDRTKPATPERTGVMSKEDKVKLDAATDQNTSGALVERGGEGRIAVAQVDLGTEPQGGGDAATKQYVDDRHVGLPFAMAAGEILIGFPDNGQSLETYVTFPPGRFTVRPEVSATPYYGYASVSITDRSTKGMTIKVWNLNTGKSAATGPWDVTWIAVQMEPDSAEG